MREIKFRAWDKKTKSMISEVYEIGFGDRHSPETWLVGDDRQTDSFELMQFTGLKDRNGKEIYEGDIVRLIEAVKIVHEPEFEQINFIGKIEWDNEGADYNIIGNNEDDFRGLGNGRQEIEVIGNIYEHKHLLKK